MQTDTLAVTETTTVRELATAFALTAIFPEFQGKAYCRLGLIGEVGEVANDWKKVIRDDNGNMTQAKAERISSELGDVLWYILVGLTEYGELTDVKLSAFRAMTPDDIADILSPDGATPYYCNMGLLPSSAASFMTIEARRNILTDFVTVLSGFKREACTSNAPCEPGLFNIEYIANCTLQKLASRSQRGTLAGSGENR